jgi:hypothetical protein
VVASARQLNFSRRKGPTSHTGATFNLRLYSRGCSDRDQLPSAAQPGLFSLGKRQPGTTSTMRWICSVSRTAIQYLLEAGLVTYRYTDYGNAMSLCPDYKNSLLDLTLTNFITALVNYSNLSQNYGLNIWRGLDAHWVLRNSIRLGCWASLKAWLRWMDSETCAMMRGPPLSLTSLSLKKASISLCRSGVSKPAAR